MGTSDQQAIRTTIDDLELKARASELQAQRYREAATTLRDAYGVHAVGPIDTAPARGTGDGGRVSTNGRGKLELTDDNLIAILAASPAPMQSREILKTFKEHKVALRRRLNRLDGEGRIKITGNRAATRYAVAVKRGASSSKEELPRGASAD